MKDDELILVSPLDSFIDPSDSDVDIRKNIQRIIDEAVAEKNVKKAVNICYQIVRVLHMGGLALAESLHAIYAHWSEFGINDRFEDVIAATTGLHKATVQHYTLVWEKLYTEENVPKQFKDDLRKMNIKSQIPIAQALNAGYEIDKEGWKELTDSPDFSSVSALLRQIKGKEPRSQALILMMDTDGGIRAIKGEVDTYVGWLKVDDESLVVRQAVARIVNESGILQR